MILLGAGGFAREVFCWVRDYGGHVRGFYQDPGKPLPGRLPAPLLDSLGGLEGEEFLVAVGDPSARRGLWAKALGAGLVPADPVVHPSAVVGNSVELLPGVIICPMAVVTTDCRIGRGAILNLAATVGHDTVLGDWVTVSPGANISGKCRIGEFCYVGTNAAIREGITMGRNSTLGMGAVLTKDLVDGETWVGNPARKLTPKV